MAIGWGIAIIAMLLLLLYIVVLHYRMNRVEKTVFPPQRICSICHKKIGNKEDPAQIEIPGSTTLHLHRKCVGVVDAQAHD